MVLQTSQIKCNCFFDFIPYECGEIPIIPTLRLFIAYSRNFPSPRADINWTSGIVYLSPVHPRFEEVTTGVCLCVSVEVVEMIG